MNPTNDPALRSFVPVPPDSHFPIQNLPYGVFQHRYGGTPRIGVAIGDQVLDLSILEEEGLLKGPHLRDQPVFRQASLNTFLALGKTAWTEARSLISHLLREDDSILRDNTRLRNRALVPAADVEMLLPAVIGDYTDFYSSLYHATNAGSMLRGKDNALTPNWRHLPVAYHGRSSSIVVSGTDLRRPKGQTKGDLAAAPTFGPSRAVDFELEAGFLVGPGNELGRPIPVAEAEDRIFGLVLVNDWSARDLQKWESQPLGPFLAKNFGTSISPWVVPLEALEPFRSAGANQDPAPLPYLCGRSDGTYDIHLEVWLQAESMERPSRICASNFKNLYWSVAQQLAHHTVNGCNLRPGDLLASGTISGPEPGSYGCLLEQTWMGTQPLSLPSGEKRTFLQDGDRITMTGWCQGNGYRVGFGEVTGRILPALP